MTKGKRTCKNCMWWQRHKTEWANNHGQCNAIGISTYFNDVLAFMPVVSWAEAEEQKFITRENFGCVLFDTGEEQA